MDDHEASFDTLARKASTPTAGNVVHEVDTAFASHGITNRRVLISNAGKVNANGGTGEKVFAVSHKGALGFGGKNSNSGGQRYYAVIYPKGFIQHYGATPEMASKVTTKIPVGDNFKRIAEENGKVFVIRNEPATVKTGGQVHLQDSDEFKFLEINGAKKSQFQWMRENALGIVEYDGNGKILQVRTFIDSANP